MAIQRRLHAAGAVGVEAAAAATQAATTGAAAALVAAAQGAGATSDTAAAAAAVAATSGRVRPLIYVYNIPDEVVSHILQYRTIKVQCGWRLHNTDNTSTLLFETYGMEVLLPDLILGSAHRTLDPSEADFFYVPVLASCWMTYLQGVQDGPWFNVDRWGQGWAGGGRASVGWERIGRLADARRTVEQIPGVPCDGGYTAAVLQTMGSVCCCICPVQ